MNNKHLVVLGGGVSGLSAAWFAAKSGLSSHITLLESSPHVGGWVQSQRNTDTHSHASALFEAGPRTLRPNGPQGAVTLDMVYRLGLEKEVISVEKTSAAAKNRFISFNGALNKMPTSLAEALFPKKGHVFRGVIARGALEPFIAKSTLDDESIHDFVARRFGTHVADNMISALVHGIYAGDSRQLSVKSCFPFLWQAEKNNGSVVKSLLMSAFKNAPEEFSKDFSPKSLEFIKKIKSKSIYAFKDGLQTFTDAISDDLKTNHPNVSLLTNTNVIKLSKSQNGVEVSTSCGKTISASHVISTIPSFTLQHLLPEASTISPILSKTPAVTVAVVNLAYKKPNILPVTGFGYLVPRTQKSNVIGVIFDSEAVPGQDEVPMTRVTCMMGGHRFKEVFGEDGFSSEKCLEMARDAIKKDLGIDAVPSNHCVHLHRDCIPQYTVGHEARLKNLHHTLLSEFGGRLSVAGSSYLGVGVNDCVVSAKNVTAKLAESLDSPVTGLEKVVS
ncbi:oxygen-dependent protoporphyrinogen oxidase [Chytriomyces hyalinus]|nr:oxygen-dependent protoporphyrinogen oxidase [Chytriomyces hyalinus]